MGSIQLYRIIGWQRLRRAILSYSLAVVIPSPDLASSQYRPAPKPPPPARYPQPTPKPTPKPCRSLASRTTDIEVLHQAQQKRPPISRHARSVDRANNTTAAKARRHYHPHTSLQKLGTRACNSHRIVVVKEDLKRCTRVRRHQPTLGRRPPTQNGILTLASCQIFRAGRNRLVSPDYW